MTLTEAAAELGVTRQTLHTRIKRGQMRGVLVHQRLWMIPKSEVERWRKLGLQKPGPKPGKQLRDE